MSDFSVSFMKPWYWLKMLKLSDSAGKKLKLAARGFNFFRPNWQFQHLSQITVSWNLPKNWTFPKTATKTVIVTVSFKWNRRKKKNPVSLLKLTRFYETDPFFMKLTRFYETGLLVFPVSFTKFTYFLCKNTSFCPVFVKKGFKNQFAIVFGFNLVSLKLF